MNNDSRLTYALSHESWYWLPLDGAKQEVMIHRSALDDDGNDSGCFWEFSITWHDLGRGSELSPRVEVFDDAFVAFTEIPKLFESLQNMKPCTVERIAALLDALGFVDTTDRAPRPKRVAPCPTCGREAS